MAGSSRRRNSRSTTIAVSVSIALHLVLFGLIVRSLRPLPELAPVPTMTVEFLAPSTRLLVREPRLARRSAPTPLVSGHVSPPQPLAPRVASSPIAPGVSPGVAVGPEANPLDAAGLRKALRGSIGCANAEAVGLTTEERLHCQGQIRDLSANARQTDTLPADPARRAAIEHTARSDSIMKEYRNSRRMDAGDYPGLRTLFGKDPLPPTDPPN